MDTNSKSEDICDKCTLLMDKNDILESMLKFLGLIMSSKSKEEEQTEALEYLKSNQNVLTITLKKIAKTSIRTPLKMNLTDRTIMPSVHEDGLTRCNRSSHYNDNEISRPQTPLKDSTLANKNASTVIQNNKWRSFNDENPIQAESKHSTRENMTVTSRCTNDEVKKSTVVNKEKNEIYDVQSIALNGEYPKRTRKSKYHHLDGDLSLIRREPKCISQKKSKYNNNCEMIDTNRMVARKMIDILTTNTSMYHKEHVIAILRDDASLRNVFHQERARAGKQSVPVMRNTKTKEIHFNKCKMDMNSSDSKREDFLAMQQNQHLRTRNDQLPTLSADFPGNKSLKYDLTNTEPETKATTALISLSSNCAYPENNSNSLSFEGNNTPIPFHNAVNNKDAIIQQVSELRDLQTHTEEESTEILQNLSVSVEMENSHDFSGEDSTYPSEIPNGDMNSNTFDEAFREHIFYLTDYNPI